MATETKTSPEAPPANVFVGRQPILDRERQVFAYELLFRSQPDQNFFSATDGNLATCQTINNSLNVMGLTPLVGPHKAFINVTRDVLVRELYMVLPTERVVVEILEDINPDAQVVAACRRLKDAGYLMALDDFVMRPGFEPLLEMADFVKIEFLGASTQQRLQAVEQFTNRETCLLAEKVETQEDFSEALGLGYSYFQGYFFCKPTVVAGRQIPAFKRNYLRFLQEVTKAAPDYTAVEMVIKEEPSLSVKLLRYLSSAFVGMRAKVSSIRQALALLGERPLRQWAALVALTSLGEDKPGELVTMCLVRARFCEQISKHVGGDGREMDFFLLGLLSGIDALVDRPLSEVLAEMPVAHDVKAALLGSRTLMGSVYGLAIACERGNPTVVSLIARRLQLNDEQVSAIQYESILWADKVLCA